MRLTFMCSCLLLFCLSVLIPLNVAWANPKLESGFALLFKGIETTPCQTQDLTGRWASRGMLTQAPKGFSQEKIKEISNKVPEFWPKQVFLFKSNGQVQMLRSIKHPSNEALKKLDQAFKPEDNPMTFQVSKETAALTLTGKKTIQYRCFKALSSHKNGLYEKGDLLWDVGIKVDQTPFLLHYVMMKL